MDMLTPAMAFMIGLVVLLGAVCFYLYSRINYVEKRFGMTENFLVELKMAMESSDGDQGGEQPMPLVGGSAAAAPEQPALATAIFAPVPDDDVDATPAKEDGTSANVTGAPPDDSYYSSLLQEVQDATSTSGEIPSAADDTSAKADVGPNYDSMTRSELSALAEQRGIRITKRAGRGEIITLLRKSDSSKNEAMTTGTENGSGASGSLFPNASSLEGDFPVDLGQSGAVLEEATL